MLFHTGALPPMHFPQNDSPPRSAYVLLLLLLTTLSGCGDTGPTPAEPKPRDQPSAATAVKPGEVQTPLRPTQEPSIFRFTEIAEQAGVDFRHVSGMTKERYFPTANGSGLAVFDYDGDGRMDLYFASANNLPLAENPEGQNRLFRNLGDNQFEDVTEKSGLGFRGFCHGVITGDLDNDGDQDVFLATYLDNRLYLNNGDGTFRDVSRAAGVARPAFHGTLVVSADAPESVTIDAVDGLRWRINGSEPTDDLTVPIRKGQRLIFRQADSTAPRALDLLVDPSRLQSPGDPAKTEAWFREIGTGATRIAAAEPALEEGAEPVVLAELEVVAEPDVPVPFQCAQHRPAWSSGGACLDYDGDGDLDMYVSNYGWWTVEQHGSKFCGSSDRKVRQYCSPKEVTTVKHLLYRNDGLRDGVPHFTNVYDEFLVNNQGEPVPGRSDGHGFGVVTADLNQDGRIDIYVANDQNPAFVFLNQGGGKFLDAVEESGAAYDEKGATQSGMGVDAEDIDGDGQPELFKTHFANEYNTLYQNLGRATFYDQTAAYGLAADAMPWVGWGCVMADFDSDGWPDAFVTNGHVDDNYDELGVKNVPYAEPPLLWRNVAMGEDTISGSRRFRIATRDVGPYFEASHVGRGVAYGDLDDDGDIDLVVNHKDGQAGILRNDTPMGDNRWIRLKLTGTQSNRDAIGSQVQVVTSSRTIVRQRKGGVSLESTNDPRLTIGVGPNETIETLIVRWPSGVETTLKNVATNQQLDLVEPDAPLGEPAPAAPTP